MKALKLLTGIFVLGNLGCANWALRESCEKTNWFDYAQNVAFQGKYLEEDGFVKACQNLEKTSAVQVDLGFKQGREKMCQYDEILARGREGIPVFFKFCDGLDEGRMKSMYRQGLETYCTNEKGYTYAKTGKLYHNLCTAEQEKKFLPGYYKGRREYLTSLVADYRKAIQSLRERLDSFEKSEAGLNSEYSRLPKEAQECRIDLVYDEVQKKNENRKICEEAHYIRQRRTSLWSDLDRTRGQIRDLRADWAELEGKIGQAEADLRAIP